MNEGNPHSLDGQTLFHKIVLAACGSESCSGAMRESLKLAKQVRGELIGVSVVLGGGDLDDFRLDGGAEPEIHAEKVAHSVCEMAAAEGVVCKGVVRHDQDASAAIADVANEEGADLIVMGRRDRSVLERFLFGSVASDLAHKGDFCILVVPKEARYEGRHILLATDGDEHSILATVYAQNLAKLAGAGITAVVVGSEESKTFPAWRKEAETVVGKVAEWAKREGIVGNGVIRYGVPDQEILAAAHDCGADLIVVGSHGRIGLSRILQGSISDKVVAGAACPVMIVRG